MDLFCLILALSSIQLASSKDGKISFELNMPTFLNPYFGLDKMQKTIQATVVTSGEKHTNLAFDLFMRNNTKYSEDNQGMVQRSNQAEQPKIDLFQIKMQGIDDAIALARAVRSFLPKNLTQLANMIKSFDVKHPSTLNELVAENQQRSQKIREFNFHFPQVFANPRRNGLQPIRPWVESAPGAYKMEIVTYPPNFLVKRLKFLVQYDKQQKEKELTNDRWDY